MNFLPYLLIFVLLLVIAGLIRQYFGLIRRINEFSDQLPNESFNPLDVPKELERLAGAVRTLRSKFEDQTSVVNAESNRLATVLEQLTDGILIANANGLVQFSNPAACRLFETSNPINRSVAEVVRNHQLIEAWRRCQLSREMQSESVELPIKRQFLQLIVIPDALEGGSLLVVQDLTRVRRLETVRRDFISNVSHELRTPLASLKALTETLQNGALSDPTAGPRFLGRISTEVDALTQMAQELLDLSRIESGQVELIRSQLSPKHLLCTAVDRMKLQAERAGLKLIVDCDDHLPSFQGDKARLEQVLVNLIHNSVKFTRPGGQITLRAESIGRRIRCEVQDTGAGIPSESLTRIFERFYRVDRSRTGSGTGLGLSISKHIVEAHEGKIWAESEEGRGSTIIFEIPN